MNEFQTTQEAIDWAYACLVEDGIPRECFAAIGNNFIFHNHNRYAALTIDETMDKSDIIKDLDNAVKFIGG